MQQPSDLGTLDAREFFPNILAEPPRNQIRDISHSVPLDGYSDVTLLRPGTVQATTNSDDSAVCGVSSNPWLFLDAPEHACGSQVCIGYNKLVYANTPLFGSCGW